MNRQYYQEKLNKSRGNIMEIWTVIREFRDLKKNREASLDLLNIDATLTESLKVNEYFTNVECTLANELLCRMN